MYQIDETKMIRSAKDSLALCRPERSMFSECMIFVLVTFICSLPQSIVSSVYTTIAMLTDPEYYKLILSESLDFEAIDQYVINFSAGIPSWVYAMLLACSGFMILGALIYCKKFQKRSPFTLGFSRRGVLPEYLAGAVIGLVMISIPALICLITKCVTFSFNANVDPLMIALFLGAFLLQGMGEEALFRGYLMTSLARRHNVWVAIITSAVIFAVFHMGNPNFSVIAFLNITLFGLFAGVYMLKRGSIWGIGAIHSLWNFAQSNLFGFNVSGNPKFDTVFHSQNADFGTILSGGEFGLEGGLGATVILLVAILLALLMPTKESEKCTEPPKEKIELDI